MIDFTVVSPLVELLISRADFSHVYDLVSIRATAYFRFLSGRARKLNQLAKFSQTLICFVGPIGSKLNEISSRLVQTLNLENK